MSQIYKIIGVMSGTSLDGLDLAYCEFELKNDKWHYAIGATQTIAYDQTWHTRLAELHKQPMFLLPKTDAYFGKYIGQSIRAFIKENNIAVDFIASHGHTIFHNPAEGYTTQIGSGAAIYAETGIPTICDFRSVDVALGGQGAPLVPIGDALLFSEYDACLNLGGFANISFTTNEERLAFDICPCNVLLNDVAKQEGFAFDKDGKIAASGKVNQLLLDELNQLSFYSKQGAKSLGREWVEQAIWPIVKKHQITLEDLMATFVEHIVVQIAAVLAKSNSFTLLTTGGGALNTFLMQRLEAHFGQKISSGSPQLIQYKEALVFAFLGVLRFIGKVNSLCLVTDATHDNIGGAIYGVYNPILTD